MRFTILGSGSTGNAVLISSETTNVLVDAGMSAREIVKRLAEVGVSPDKLDGIMVTHDLSYALQLCPRSVILSAGRIVADGTTSELLADAELLARHRLELPYGFDPATATA